MTCLSLKLGKCLRQGAAKHHLNFQKIGDSPKNALKTLCPVHDDVMNMILSGPAQFCACVCWGGGGGEGGVNANA